MKNTMLMVVLFFLGGIAGFVLGNSITRVPKEILTASRLVLLEEEILVYYGRTGKLPEDLDSLHLGRENLLDAWGNELLYAREGETQCVLRSSRKVYGENSVDGIIEKRIVVPRKTN